MPPAGGRVLVVGAGLAGLACAHRLRRAGREVLVLEAAPRAGGVVGTLEERGFLFETGPNTVPAVAPAFSALVRELGLEERVLLSGAAARTRLLWHRGRPVALPSSPGAFLATPLLSARAKLRLLAEPLRRRPPHPAGAPEPTLAAFLEERLGREAARRLGGAFVRGVHGGEIDRLGARSAFPGLWALAEEHGGLARGLLARARARRAADGSGPPAAAAPPRGALASFPGGFETFVDALARGQGEDLSLGERAVRLARRGGLFEVETAGGARHAAEHVVLAVPAPVAASLLSAGDRAEGAARAAARLAEVEYASMTVVHLGFADEAGVPAAFGCLVPPEAAGEADAPRFLGVLFPARMFPGRAPAGGQIASCFYRLEEAGPDPARRAREDLARLGVGRGAQPAASRVLQWPLAIPQYAPGHDERLSAAEEELARALPGLHLAASYVGGVSVDAVSSRGRAVADRILERPEAASASRFR